VGNGNQKGFCNDLSELGFLVTFKRQIPFNNKGMGIYKVISKNI
jgi:hypothetical protein